MSMTKQELKLLTHFHYFWKWAYF